MGDWAYVVNITDGEGPKIFEDLGFIALQTTRDHLKQNRAVDEKMVCAMVKAQNFISDPKNQEETTWSPRSLSAWTRLRRPTPSRRAARPSVRPFQRS